MDGTKAPIPITIEEVEEEEEMTMMITMVVSKVSFHNSKT
jgi:hypothetical protein